jgi:hypothetical protein
VLLGFLNIISAALVETIGPTIHTVFSHKGSLRSPVTIADKYPNGKPMKLSVKKLSSLNRLSTRRLGRPSTSIPTNANGYAIGVSTNAPVTNLVRLILGIDHAKDKPRPELNGATKIAKIYLSVSSCIVNLTLMAWAQL